MLTILTSLRAKTLADNWDHHVTLLDHALQSMLSNVGSFQIVVVCHEVPDVPSASDKRVTFLSVDLAVPKRINDDMCVDKVLKLSIGTRWALERGTDYVMFTDADDLVNRKIVALVERRHGEPGWYSGIEYYCTYPARIYRTHTVPPGTSGSCVIVRSDLLEFDSPPFQKKLTAIRDERPYLDILASRQREVNVLAAVGHPDYVRLLETDGQRLQPFPFAANLKIKHYDSTSHVSGGIGYAGSITDDSRPIWRRIASLAKRTAIDLSTMQPITRNIKRDFTLSDRLIRSAEVAGRTETHTALSPGP